MPKQTVINSVPSSQSRCTLPKFCNFGRVPQQLLPLICCSALISCALSSSLPLNILRLTKLHCLNQQAASHRDQVELLSLFSFLQCKLHWHQASPCFFKLHCRQLHTRIADIYMALAIPHFYFWRIPAKKRNAKSLSYFPFQLQSKVSIFTSTSLMA